MGASRPFVARRRAPSAERRPLWGAAHDVDRIYRAGGASCARIACAAVMRAGMGKFLFASITMPILRAGTKAT